MKDFLSKVLYIAVAILLFALFAGISWISVCGIIKLITMCFDKPFNWKIATGIWLIMVLVSSVINKNSGRDV